jgi:hypothetical protein
MGAMMLYRTVTLGTVGCFRTLPHDTTLCSVGSLSLKSEFELAWSPDTVVVHHCDQVRSMLLLCTVEIRSEKDAKRIPLSSWMQVYHTQPLVKYTHKFHNHAKDYRK